jgi:hypothetical protein
MIPMKPLGKGPSPEEKGSCLVRNALDTIDVSMRARLWFSVITALLTLNLSLTFHNVWPT